MYLNIFIIYLFKSDACLYWMVKWQQNAHQKLLFLWSVNAIHVVANGWIFFHLFSYFLDKFRSWLMVCWWDNIGIPNVLAQIACVASASIGFGNKERQRNGIFGVFPTRKMGREPKKKWKRGWRGETKETLVDKPLDFEFFKVKPMSGASANGLSCGTFLLSPARFVWLAHTSSGGLTARSGVPVYIPRYNCTFAKNSTYVCAYTNRLVMRLGNRRKNIIKVHIHRCCFLRNVQLGIYTGILDCVVGLPEEVCAGHTRRVGDDRGVLRLG